MGSLYVTFIAILTVLVIILIIRLIDGENIKKIQILNDRSPVHKSIPENVLKKNLYERTVQNFNTKTCQNHTFPEIQVHSILPGSRKPFIQT